MPGVFEPQTPPEDAPWTIDELLRQRALIDSDLPLVSYPNAGTDYVDYTAFQLDVYAYRVAQHYASFLPQRKSSAEAERVVAILSPSTIDYLITTLALTKLGFTVLFLSTRISEAAYISLLDATGCRYLLADCSMESKTTNLPSTIGDLSIYRMADSTVYSYPIKDMSIDTRLDRELDPVLENTKLAWIIHSSGSTGLPKPIYQTHGAALRNYSNNFNMRGFITLPMYHAHGISSVFRSIHSKKQIHIYNASLPLTGPALLSIMRKHAFEIFYGVPYALKLLGETEDGLNELRKLKLVMFGGSSCPDVLGDKLVKHGVKLVSHYGTTETGQLMTSFRGDDELDWNYLRVSKSLEPFIRWEDRGAGLYELVVLEGWPSKVATNREDGSYATKDLFERHATKSNCYKWSGRLDDTIVLLNGEKAIPIAIEHTVRENPYVAEAVVFGSGKPQLGMFIIPSAKSAGMSNEQIMAEVQPALNACNAESPAYAQITPDTIRILPRTADYPRTDKSTVIRAAFYNQFKDQIESVYEDLLAQPATGGTDMDVEELKAFLHSTICASLGLDDKSILTESTDFFSLGMDSLQALRIHATIVKTYNTNGNRVGQNVVFEQPTMEKLAAYLESLQKGKALATETPQERMQQLIEKYSTFRQHRPGQTASSTSAVIITGATGSLGAHVVARLVSDPAVARIYCLVRAPTVEKARSRVVASMRKRQVYHSLCAGQIKKIVALPSDFSREDLGLEERFREQLHEEVTTVIHLAWAVNFNMGVESFEQQHIAGAHNLIQFCLDSKRSRPAAFYFGSSVSAVAASSKVVEEATGTDLSKAQGMGYAQSKLVTENICAKAAQQTGIVCRVLRIGQVIGDTGHGIWNETEAIPLIVQSAETIGALPSLDECPTWLPVDIVAQSIIELSSVSAQDAPTDAVFNIVNPTTFHWTHDFLSALRSAGLSFEQVSQREWIRRLRASNADPVANPPFKLLDFFASKYDRDDKRPSLYYKTDLACSKSPALHCAPRLNNDLVKKFLVYWRTCWTKKQDKMAKIIIVAGPCGTGKTSVAEAIAKAFDIPQIEGDTLHSPEAITKMGRGDPLADDDRWSWLERIKRKALGETTEHPAVVVSCSALKKAYRDRLRQVPEDVEVVFLMLQADRETLLKRLEERREHYMKPEMVESQLEVLETPEGEEVDCLPVDAEKSLGEVEGEVVELLRGWIEA